MAHTRAQLIREQKKESLREMLARQKHVEHVVDVIQKLNDPTLEIPREMVDRYKIVIDTRMKLLNKYLPDVKSVEITTDAENPFITRTEVVLVRSPHRDP